MDYFVAIDRRNLANFDPELIASVRVRRFDGANTWEFRHP